MRRVLLAVLVLALGAAGGGVLWLQQRLAPPGEDAAPIAISIPRGASLSEIARTLEDAGVVRDARVFAGLARFREQAGELRAGEYAIPGNLPAEDVLAWIAEGRVVTHPLAIPEGLTAVEIAARVDAAGLAETEAFLAAVRDPAFAAELGVEGETLEGYLFPETYQIARGLGARAVARVMVEHFLAVWRELAPEAEAQGFSMRELVTLASIVEKETGVAAERPLVAAVFRNRLERGWRLETDPTVIYGIPEFDGNLTRRHLEDASNPYNTYRITGLPPGPIASPGEAALRAVLAPADVEYMFFVSKNDGSHHFSKSLREHVAAVDRYQRRRRSR